MAPDAPDEGFKVTDRRRRDEADEPARPTAAPRETAPPPRETPGPPREAAAPPRPAPPSERAAGPFPAEERSLVGLFMMLGSSALLALGEAADPMTGQRQRDLPAAADVIDVLALLRQKTEGHRTSEETQVIDELLYDLQLRYVKASKRSG